MKSTTYPNYSMYGVNVVHCWENMSKLHVAVVFHSTAFTSFIPRSLQPAIFASKTGNGAWRSGEGIKCM